MAKSHHIFVCKDGKPLPEWLKLPGQIECVSPDKLDATKTASANIVWVRLSSGGSSGNPVQGQDIDLIRQVSRSSHTVVMTDIPEDEQALAVFEAGARGYCNSHSNGRALKLIANVVQDGGLWIGESLMQRLVIGAGKTLENRALATRIAENQLTDVMAGLTGREREVAETIAGGASNKEVARLLGISERTVKAHVSAIFNKLGVRDRLQLTIKIKRLR